MRLKIIDVYKTESYVPVEPVTLTEAKAWILVDYADDDTLITSLITQSRGAIEDFCNISIVPKTILLTASNIKNIVGYPDPLRWDLVFYGLPNSNGYYWSELPYGPSATITSVTSLDSAGNITNLVLNTDYWVTGQEFKKIRVGFCSDNLLIQYYTPYYCPQPLKEAILNEIAFRYENRGSGVNRYAQQSVGVSEGAQALAKFYKRVWL